MVFESLGFKGAYAARILPGLPGLGTILRFHDPCVSGHSEGVVVQVTPCSGASWIGNFTLGDLGTLGAFGTPHPDRICVVARGETYIVSASKPESWELVATTTSDVRSGGGLLLLTQWTNIIAHDGMSIVWRTADISWDGMDVGKVTSTAMSGLAWSAPLQSWVPFEVDLRTGRHTGGAY
jgi:hypothetical protein